MRCSEGSFLYSTLTFGGVYNVEGFIVNLFIDLFKKVLESQIPKWKEQIEFKKFLTNTETWCNEFIQKNESTIVASSCFYDYIDRFNLIGHVIDFIRQPVNVTEKDFLNDRYNNAVEYLKEKKVLGIDDQRAVREFINKLFDNVKNFYEGKIHTEDIAAFYTLSQTNTKVDNIDAKLDKILGVVGSPTQTTTVIVQEEIVPAITKKKYSMPENIIFRKIDAYRSITEGYALLCHPENMLDACMKNGKIVLLGEAGCGKSVALKQLAAMAYETEYFPLFINLSLYTGETIESLINETYPEIDYEKVFLILDAFDEIGSEDKSQFAKKLNKFAVQNPKTIILISSRNNFYSFADEGESNGLFEGFAEYGIAPLSYSDITEYVTDNGVNYQDFWTTVCRNELYNLAVSPFYLVELLKIYKRNNALPLKTDLMEEIIRNRFSKDSKKYASEKELVEEEVKIFVCLRKLAFSIQCMKAVKISNADYQKLLPNKDDRDLIKYSGVFSKDAQNYWGFEHNNFREYLTAQLLNQLNIDQIKELVFSDQGKVFDSWMNVLSFLVLIREDQDLMQLLVENDSEMLVRFEKSRIDEADRSSIVIGILEDFAEKNIWLSRGYNDADKLAKFGESLKVIEYLLSQITTPRNFRSQSNAISVLAEIQNKYGMQTKIRSVLFDALKSSSTRYTEKHRILDAIISLNLQNEEINSYVSNTFSHDLESYYRLGILQYLHSVGLYEKHITFYTEEYNRPEKHYDDSTRIRYEILDVFTKVKQGDALCTVLSAIVQHNDTYSSDSDKYEKVVNHAIESYNSGNTKIFETIIAFFADSLIHNYEFHKISKIFFEKTQTKTIAFIRLANMDLELKTFHTISSMEQIADSDCYLELLALYEEGDLRYGKIIEYLAYRLSEDSVVYERYKSALAVNGIVLTPKEPPFDYEKARREGRQYHFDVLFDKSRYISLVEKMLSIIGKGDISFAELKQTNTLDFYHDIDRQNPEEHTILQLYFDLENEHDNRPILETLKGISDWNDYAICEAHGALHQKEIIVSEYQKQLIKQHCMDILKDLDFRKEIYDNEAGGTTYTYRSQRFIFFSEMFDFPYEKSVYLDMLFAPYYFFDREADNQYGKFPKYVLDKLTCAELQSRIQYNLANETMCSDVLEMHIQYCQDNNLDWGVELAEKICLQDSGKSHCKRKCIEYLEQIRGYDYIYETFLPNADKETLEVIINLTLKYRDARLKDKLEMLNKASEDGQAYLSTLIYLNSKYALHRYYEIISKTMQSTNIKDESYIDSTLEAISVVKDTSLIEELDALRILLFTPGFKDKDAFGLQHGLYKAYENLSEIDYELVKKHLEDGLKNEAITESDKCFCNTLLLDITNKQKRQRDRVWTVDEIKTFIETIRKE